MKKYPLIVVGIGILIVLVSFVLMIVYWRSIKLVTANGIGSVCVTIVECKSGLICSDEQCRIPENGSCVRDPSMCELGLICSKGKCVYPFVNSNAYFYPDVDSAERKMTSCG